MDVDSTSIEISPFKPHFTEEKLLYIVHFHNTNLQENQIGKDYSLKTGKKYLVIRTDHTA